MTLLIFVAAAVAEIAGCFAIWAIVRQGANPLWLVAGALALLAFAWLLTRVDVDFAGRAYAAYGGVYIAAAVVWLWAIEGRTPDRWDILGALVSVAGAGIILFGPRSG